MSKRIRTRFGHSNPTAEKRRRSARWPWRTHVVGPIRREVQRLTRELFEAFRETHPRTRAELLKTASRVVSERFRRPAHYIVIRAEIPSTPSVAGDCGERS